MAIIMNYINIAKFVLINELEKVDSMIETRPLKNIVIFVWMNSTTHRISKVKINRLWRKLFGQH